MKDPIHEAAKRQGFKLVSTGSARYPFGKVLGGRTRLETRDEKGRPLQVEHGAVLYLYPETADAKWEIIIWPEREDDWHLTCDDIKGLRAGGARIVFKGGKVYRVRRITRTPLVDREKSVQHGKRGGLKSAAGRAKQRGFTNGQYREKYMAILARTGNKSQAAYHVQQAQREDGHSPATKRGIVKYFDAHPMT